MGRVFVLGAGVSKEVCYPLGSELFNELDQFVRGRGRSFDRFDYAEWPKLCDHLSRTANTLVRSAYQKRQIELLFTILDLSWLLKSEELYDSYLGLPKATEAEKSFKRLDLLTRTYLDYRRILLCALQAYFLHRHEADLAESDEAQGHNGWNLLRTFCRKLKSGDVVITFNYDSTIERILLEQRKWSPSTGYGFEIPLMSLRPHPTRLAPVPSVVIVLHLHGAIGWFQRSAGASSGSAWIPIEKVAAGALTSEVALDPLILQGLGMHAVDAALPTRPPNEAQILLHPSFFKDYELEDEANTVFIRMWKEAAEMLRSADEVHVIGYSLPKADSSAMTLLLTNCDPAKVSIVNRNKVANHRLRQLLSEEKLGPPRCFHEWVMELDS